MLLLGFDNHIKKKKNVKGINNSNQVNYFKFKFEILEKVQITKKDQYIKELSCPKDLS